MSMLKERFYGASDKLFESIRKSQKENIEAAGQMMAGSVAAGGCVHLFDTGHIIDSELLNRAGGLVLMRRFRYHNGVESSAKKRSMESKNTSAEGLAEYALRAANILPGDVMVIGSVSGKTLNVIDLAVECKKMGVKVIGVTSVEYSKTLESGHSCGKRLFELADVTIDNCAPFGDAMLDIEGVEAAFIPASGIAAAYICWAVCAELVEKLLEKNIVPGILKSVNYPPNAEYNNKLYKRYDEEGV
ncbi:MAG: sugar isomerase domain-containing protein [Oscillospiraceae bacterium]|nr:sugar isomerase domain-containing protein [Oscillospiraceae bacterium]